MPSPAVLRLVPLLWCSDLTFYTIGLQFKPINGQCCAGFVVLLHHFCTTQRKERQTTPKNGAETAVGEEKAKRAKGAFRQYWVLERKQLL
jgi:hypothetical protein